MLNASKVESLIKSGNTAYVPDGSGGRGCGRLYLRVRQLKTGSYADWLCQWFDQEGRKRRLKIGIAGKGGLTLRQARDEFAKLSDWIQKGLDPKEELQREARELEQKRKAEEQERRRKAIEDTIFDDLMTEYMRWARVAKTHYAHDEQRYRLHLKSFLGRRKLCEIGLPLLQDIRAELEKKGLSPGTVKHCLILVRQAYNKAALWGLWDGPNPVKPKSGLLPKLNNSKLRALNHKEEEQLLNLLWTRSPSTHDMSMVSLYAGLRFSEVAALRWQDVDQQQKRLIVHGKGERTRVVPLNKTLVNLLSRRKAEMGGKDADLVFPDRKGKQQTKVSNSFPRAVKELGLNEGRDARYHVNFHSLRHTFATRLASQGTPITVLRDLLGHADLQMVSRYSHLAPSEADAAVGRLDTGSGSSKVIEFPQSTGTDKKDS